MKPGLPEVRLDLAWFFDIDGTLAELTERPELVQVDPAIRRLLSSLYERTGGALALVSGRSISVVDALFPGTRFPVAGQHGLERRSSSGAVVRNPPRSERLLAFREAMTAMVLRHPGLLLEDKGLSLALHYRQAPQLGALVHREMRALLASDGPDFQLLAGKRVVEILPGGSNKGLAVRQFMQEPPFRGRTPAFVGDDVTDEHAFAIVNELAGYSVKVGPGPTLADWRLDDVTAVRAWLES